jgi:hypothetical protein
MSFPVEKCVSCAYFKQHPKPQEHLGECTLKLPPWLERRLAEPLDATTLYKTVRVDAGCSLGNWSY